MNLLVIEDDPVIGKSLHKGLTEAGHACDLLKDGEQGLQAAVRRAYDTIVLDLLLPGLPGLEVLKKMRAAGVRTCVIVLTALGSVDERVAGLNAGADDYLVKPFALAELLARIEAISRRTVSRPPVVLEVGPVKLDLATRRVTGGGAEIDLTPTEFSLLEFLMRHDGHVVTRKMLCEHLWGGDWEGTTNVIEVHVNRLRNKLVRCCPEPLIQTVRGRGYAIRAS